MWEPQHLATIRASTVFAGIRIVFILLFDVSQDYNFACGSVWV
jgi:hypothetical protein